jgi:trigger factor
MSVVLEKQEVGPCRQRLTVEVPAPAVEAEMARVTREYGASARVPGFRKGKVPVDLVRRRFAKEIEREVIERLLPRYWKQAEAETELKPLMAPSVEEVKDLEPGGPLTFIATVETRPTIELRNIKDFDLPNPEVDPGELDVDQAIDDLRTRFGTWIPISRPASRGDRVKAEISKAAPEGEQAAPVPQPIEVVVGDPQVWEELSLALSGLTVGQSATFTRQGEEPATELRYSVKVGAVEERELPLLDDEFAAKVSPDFKDVATFRTAVTDRLRAQRVEERENERQRAVLDQLRERHPLELPHGVVHHEVDELVADYAEGMRRRGLDTQRAQIDWNALRKDMHPLGERRVHARLLLDAIAEAESIVVGDEEFERALSVLARAQGTSTPALRRSLDENGRLAGLRDQLTRDKVMRRLLGEEPFAAEAPEAETSKA